MRASLGAGSAGDRGLRVPARGDARTRATSWRNRRCPPTRRPRSRRWPAARSASSASRWRWLSRRRGRRPRTSLEEIEVEYDELPVYADVRQRGGRDHRPPARRAGSDNVFVTLRADRDFDELAAQADVVVHRKVDLARQCMMPMEGKAVLAYWDDQCDQLVVVSATQVPHLIRTGLVAVPRPGGGAGARDLARRRRRLRLQVRAAARRSFAWPGWPRPYRRPFRYLEDRREHLVAGANCARAPLRADRLCRPSRHACSRSTLGSRSTAAPIRSGRSPIGLEPGQAVGNLPGPYAFRGYRCETRCVATNKPGFLPYRGVARTGVCFAIELTMDAIAREVGREPWEVRLENLVPARPDAVRQRRQQALRQRRLSRRACDARWR